MPVYRNKKTGIEFFTVCKCQGSNIEEVPEAPATVEKPQPVKKATTRKKTAEK